jgi:hypothetical protein
MLSTREYFAGLVLALMAISAPAGAEGVFLEKDKAGHVLTDAENRQLDAEFKQQFGNQSAAGAAKSNNPWEAKKGKPSQNNNASWGNCRDFALQQRNRCYKEGRDAYSCERLYEGRQKRCDTGF